jgi:hypothetical protein
MATGFVAVIRPGSATDRRALHAAGATAVLSWAELATSGEPDDRPAVLFSHSEVDRSELDQPGLDAAGLDAVLATLIAVDPPGRSAGGPVPADRDVVVATVRPVVDTLKLVDAQGILTGTAERDEHRFVGTPIAARLRVLRALSRELECPAPGLGGSAAPGPTAVAVLAALVRRGATVLGSTP